MAFLFFTHHRAPLFAAGAALILTLGSSCGEAERERVEAIRQSQLAREADARARQEAESQPRLFEVDVSLRGPQRVINGHPSILAAWADPLRDRIDPENDQSWREKVAVRFESGCEALVRALLSGDAETASQQVSDSFAGFEAFLPSDFGDAVFDDGSFAVFDHVATDADSESLDAAIERAGRGEWSRAEDLEVIASVVDLVPLSKEQGTWSCELELRMVGEIEGIPTLLDSEARATILESEDPAGQPSLLKLEVSRSRLIRRPRTTFKSISGALLRDLPNWHRDFALGCEDYDLVADRRRINFGTGMLGMALGDVNGDGRDDIYVSMISGIPNKLLLCQEDRSLVDVAPDAGVDLLNTTRGGLFVDLDGDGDQELCLGLQANLLIYWNDGTGKFSEPQMLEGEGTSPIYSLSAADPDLDGDLDVFCCRYRTGSGEAHVPTPYHNATNGAANFFWRNDGERQFTEAGAATGLTSGDPRYSFIALWDDFDEDGRIDLYVVNDFGPNNLYINTEEGFVDRAESMGMLDASTGMGITGADVELDGDLDYYVTNMFSAPGLRSISEPEYREGDEAIRPLHRKLADGMSLLLQEEPGSYTENAALAEVDHGGWAWGALFYDWNLDGYPEIYVPNGFVTNDSETDVETLFWRWIVATTPTESVPDEEYGRNWLAMSSFNRSEGFSYNGNERNHVYLNLGGGQYADISPISDVDFIDDGRVAARTDWDNDGLEDLVLVNRTAPRLRIVRNAHPNAGHRIVIDLVGKLGMIDAVGARIRVARGDGKVVTQTVYAGEGLLGQSSHKRFFGLGSSSDAVDVEVTWPDGEVQRFEELAVDRGWRLQRTDGAKTSWEFEASPFESLEHDPVEPNPDGVRRIVLSDKMPLRYLALLDANGRKTSLEALPKTPKLLTIWEPSSRSGLACLRDLAVMQAEVLKVGAVIAPVALLGDGQEAGAELLDQLGLSELALNATAQEELILEALLVEILGNFEDIPLPLSLLLDAESKLCALYYGTPQREELLEDLRRTKSMQPGVNDLVALTGGYWISHPKRRYGQIKRALMMLGARDLADDLKKSKQ